MPRLRCEAEGRVRTPPFDRLPRNPTSIGQVQQGVAVMNREYSVLIVGAAVTVPQ
jgi:hypothetical protein